MIIPVILSGGAGTRLWPLSRQLYPKQLHPLTGKRTLLQETVARLQGVDSIAEPIVVCHESHRFMVAEQLHQLQMHPQAIILEPCGRNTAPAVAVAAFQAMSEGEDPVLIVLPSDHVIQDLDIFQSAIETGAELAKSAKLVTFGIVPEKPETGYGYIQAGERLDSSGTLKESCIAGFKVVSFKEKPDFETALSYLECGGYYWNSGMFMFHASSFLEELQRFNPQMLDACSSAHRLGEKDLDFTRLDKVAFAASPSDSIDYAVMEKTESAAVIPLQAGWSDIGSWSALWDLAAKNEEGNVLEGDVLVTGTRNCYFKSSTRMLAGVGVEDIVVVETGDAVLVAHKDRVQDVKVIVEELSRLERDEVLLHRRVKRPWGSYECIDSGARFQVKKITVNPGDSLSLQMHHHRAEHWVVVKGTAKVTCADEVRIISENESTYIPLGALHRLENPGQIPLEIIEVQSGSYLGEDDIVRFDDHYGRG